VFRDLSGAWRNPSPETWHSGEVRHHRSLQIILCVGVLLGLLALDGRSGHCGTFGMVVVVPAPTAQSFYVMVDPSLVPAADRKKTKLSFIMDSVTLWTHVVDVPSLFAPYGAWVNYSNWGTGALSVLVQTVNPDESLTDLGSIPLTIPSSYPWNSFQWPTLPLVPEPFSPVQLVGNTASVYGRQYSLGGSPFLDQVNSAGQDILASPVMLTGTVEGQPLQWTMQSWYLFSQTDDKVVYKGTATSGSFDLAVTATLEFDGMLRLDYTLTPVGGAKTVRDLALVTADYRTNDAGRAVLIECARQLAKSPARLEYVVLAIRAMCAE